MFQVSEKAIEVMKEYLKDTQDPKNIRMKFLTKTD
jgi:uncharacterized protein (UPF0147 family)